jgi:hypothetical protein
MLTLAVIALGSTVVATAVLYLALDALLSRL